MQAAGLHQTQRTDCNEIQGVTPEYVRNLKEKGLEISENEIIAMRVQGVTPEYVSGIRALGSNQLLMKSSR